MKRLGLLVGFIAVVAFGAPLTTQDTASIGSRQATTAKSLIFERGSGVNNPEIGPNASGVMQVKDDAGTLAPIATTSGAQVLTNKDIDGGTPSNTNRLTLGKDTTTNLDALTDKQGNLFYDTTLNKPVFNNGSANIEIATLADTGAGATGEKNYIDNSDIETNTVGYATYLDTPGTQPVDGTGGTALRLSLSQVSDTTMSGTAYLQLAYDGVSTAQGEGFSYDFTIDQAQADANRVMEFSVEIDATAASYASGDMIACMFETTGNNLITVDYENSEAIASGDCQAILKQNQVYYFKFNATSASTDYRMTFHHGDGGTGAAWNLKFDNFKVAPAGFQLAQDEAKIGDRIGYVGLNGIQGSNGDTIPSGYIGNVITDNLLTLITQASPTSGTWYDVTGISISVPPGNWLITAGCGAIQGEITGASGTLLRLGLGIRVGSTVLDEIQASIGLLSGAITYAQSLHIPSYYHSSLSTTVIKLSMRAFKDTGSGTLANLYCRGDLVDGGQGNFIKAIRMP